MLKSSFYGNFSFAKGGVVPPPPPTSKWITPTDGVCKANGGKINKHGACVANWENAKKICRASGGKFPSRADLEKVVVDCGGSVAIYGNKDWDSLTDKNIANKSYQSCYKEKGFPFYLYWSSTIHASHTNSAWFVDFLHGVTNLTTKSDNHCVRCVRSGE